MTSISVPSRNGSSRSYEDDTKNTKEDKGWNAEPAEHAEVTRATAAGAAGRERNVKGLANANPKAATCLCWRGPCRFAARSAGDRARGLSCLSCPSWSEARSSLRAVRSTPGHDRSVTRGRSSRFQPPLRALRALRSIRGHDRSVTRGSPRGSSAFSPADISVTAKQVSEIGSRLLIS